MSRKPRRWRGRALVAAAVGCGLAWLAGPAAAVSVGAADAYLQLTLKRIKGIDPGALQIGASVGLADQGRQASPGGTADSAYDVGVIGNPQSLGIGDGLELGSTSSGSAVGPLGLADSFTYTDGFLSVTNNSDQRARLRIRLDYDMSALGSVDDPGAEYGYARSIVGLESTSLGVLFQAAAEADSALGPREDSVLDRLKLTLNLRPGMTETFHLVAHSEASAASVGAVPLPPAIAGLLAALGALVAVARRRRPITAGQLG